MEDDKGNVKGSSKKRLRKPKTLEFVGWGSKNLIEFLQSLGRDTTNKISENEVTAIIMSYIREKNRETPSKKKGKTVACDEKLHLLFGTRKINIIKVPDLVEKHYVENQEDSFFDYLYTPEDDKQQRLSPPDKVTKRAKQVVQKPKGTFTAIVSDNVKLLYLRKSLIQELAKTPETFESKVVGTFVRIKNPCQLVQVTGTSVDESPGLKQVDETPPKHIQFREPISKTVVDDARNPPYVSAFDDPSSSNSPLLPPVLEEPSSSFSEAGDDDPLPAIEDLQISGEPYPGHELQACGYSINGTTSCNFEWVCHLEDGSVNYIDGAKQPNYLVTADDVDLYLAIEVQPLDDRNRKGELVKVFANDNRKIACRKFIHILRQSPS